MSCDLDNLVTRLTSILKLGNDGFSRWVSLWSSYWTRAANSWLHDLPKSVLSHSCFRVPSFTCWSGNYRQVLRTGFLQRVRSVLQPLFKQFHGVSVVSVGRPHLLRRVACWISQPSLSRFCRIFLEFYHLAPICHLENAEIFDISVIMVLSSSEAHRLGEIFEVYVWQCKTIMVSKVAFSPENFFTCFLLWLWFVWAFSFSLAAKLLGFCVERFLRLCELTTGNDAHWVVVVTKIAIYGCLHHSQWVGFVVCTIFLSYFNVEFV